MDARKALKVGVVRGGGRPPGYEWSVGLLSFAFDEASNILNAAQYKHFEMQVKELAGHASPTTCPTVDVRALENEDFCEIRDKGGVLGSLNIRVFFGMDHARRALIVLGAIKKQNDGPTPTGDKVRMRLRWRNYNKGGYGYL